MGEQTLEFELLTCINMLNKKKKKKKRYLLPIFHYVDQGRAYGSDFIRQSGPESCYILHG